MQSPADLFSGEPEVSGGGAAKHLRVERTEPFCGSCAAFERNNIGGRRSMGKDYNKREQSTKREVDDLTDCQNSTR